MDTSIMIPEANKELTTVESVDNHMRQALEDNAKGNVSKFVAAYRMGEAIFNYMEIEQASQAEAAKHFNLKGGQSAASRRLAVFLKVEEGDLTEEVRESLLYDLDLTMTRIETLLEIRKEKKKKQEEKEEEYEEDMDLDPLLDDITLLEQIIIEEFHGDPNALRAKYLKLNREQEEAIDAVILEQKMITHEGELTNLNEEIMAYKGDMSNTEASAHYGLSKSAFANALKNGASLKSKQNLLKKIQEVQDVE